MEQKFILPVGEGEEQKLYLIERVFLIDGKCYFSVLNLATFDVMFGEFLGRFTDEEEKNRELIYDNFLSGCTHITFVDGYMEDMLYDAWSDGMML